jgi:hypothetical protein
MSSHDHVSPLVHTKYRNAPMINDQQPTLWRQQHPTCVSRPRHRGCLQTTRTCEGAYLKNLAASTPVMKSHSWYSSPLSFMTSTRSHHTWFTVGMKPMPFRSHHKRVRAQAHTDLSCGASWCSVHARQRVHDSVLSRCKREGKKEPHDMAAVGRDDCTWSEAEIKLVSPIATVALVPPPAVAAAAPREDDENRRRWILVTGSRNIYAVTYAGQHQHQHQHHNNSNTHMGTRAQTMISGIDSAANTSTAVNSNSNSSNNDNNNADG